MTQVFGCQVTRSSLSNEVMEGDILVSINDIPVAQWHRAGGDGPGPDHPRYAFNLPPGAHAPCMCACVPSLTTSTHRHRRRRDRRVRRLFATDEEHLPPAHHPHLPLATPPHPCRREEQPQPKQHGGDGAVRVRNGRHPGYALFAHTSAVVPHSFIDFIRRLRVGKQGATVVPTAAAGDGNVVNRYVVSSPDQSFSPAPPRASPPRSTLQATDLTTQLAIQVSKGVRATVLPRAFTH